MSDWEEIKVGNAWDWDKDGKEFVAIFMGKEEGVGPNNSKLYTFQLSDGSFRDVWGTTILDTRLKNVTMGEEVKIVFLGEKPSPNRKGKSYRDFQVFHKKS